jgi:putative transposase
MVRPHSSLENQTPAEARRALEHFEGPAHDHSQTVVYEANNERAFAQTGDEEYEIQMLCPLQAGAL